jgi:hypothetical protein
MENAMSRPPSRAEFDAIAKLATLLSQGQDLAAARANAMAGQIEALKAAQDLLAEEVKRHAAANEMLRATTLALLRMAEPHLPPSLQGGVAAALSALETER